MAVIEDGLAELDDDLGIINDSGSDDDAFEQFSKMDNQQTKYYQVLFLLYLKS